MAGASLRVITGPTASGKSALAMRIADTAPLTVVSADSRQIYRRFDVGTAKPPAADRGRVPHDGIDIVEPEERYSAARWAECARVWITTARDELRTPAIVGGTGFYLRALTSPFFEEPSLDHDLRTRLLAQLDLLETETLRRWCTALDPARASLGRTQLLRAVEIALLTGVPISRLHQEAARPPYARARYLVVDPGPGLSGWIERRVDAMLAGGWDGEVETLIQTVAPDAPAWKATGYGAVRDWVGGRLTRDAARTRVIVETRRYAKRQRTWFRHQLAKEAVTKVDPRAPDAMDLVWKWWNQSDDE
ncbi:MAG TPA: tRNA (adenosine(37)-N6)-dimethylallyltransferase MiaA [Gemmatimonadaceae bacterium]|nr:tRNA (adenosine(37)-N6)-dimethylallyltransferase MiaA [Gemmatimonadaceae bacterium]